MRLPDPKGPVEGPEKGLAPIRQPFRAAAWMGLAQLLFALMVICALVGGRGVPWQEVGATLFLFGVVADYVIARLRMQSLRITRIRESWLRSGFGTLSAAGTFYVYSAPNLPIGDAITLFATSPIFVALASAPFLGERVKRNVVLSLAFGFSGIAVVAKPSFSSAPHLIAAGTGTAMATALAMVWLRRIGPSESSEAIVVHFSCIGFGAMLLGALPVWRTPTAHDAMVLALMGLSGGLAQIAMTRAYALDHAARVSAMTYSSVVFMRVLAVPVFGEIPNAMQISGSLLVVASGIVLALGATGRRTRMQGQSPPPAMEG
ncbi:MAG: DMT family transporter [Myxococcota bacterium]|nr:DMT family transporter [Myxococcota bacterium]